MKQLSPFILAIVFLCCCLVSCKPSSSSSRALLYADSLLEISPDTALSFLRSLPVEEYSEAEQIYHGLLLTSATDKNVLSLLPCDSLIDAALDYYDKGDGYNRGRALLYKERIQFTINMPEEAMANCFEALSEIQANFFYDIDLLGGYSKSDYAINYNSTPDFNYGGSGGSHYQLSAGIGATFNYKIVKGLSVGLGVQPMVYLWQGPKKVFDAPIVGKLAYDFHCFELAFSYKQGLSKTYRIADFKGSRLSSWQFSIYVPLSKRR